MQTEKPKRRKKIPVGVKLEVALAKLGLKVEQVQWDHQPPLELREWDPVRQDTIPPANDPEHIQLLMIVEHRTKTYGPGGEKRITTAGSDANRIAKVRRINKAEEETRQKILAKGGGDAPQPTKKKHRWPSRPFPNRKHAKKEQSHGNGTPVSKGRRSDD